MERSVKSLSEVGSAGAKPGRRRMERGSAAEPEQKAETGALQVAGHWMLGRQASMEAGE